MTDSEKEYDIAYGHEYQPTDCLLGALFAHDFIGRNEKSDFGFDERPIPSDSKVLLIGNYWSDAVVTELLIKTKNVFYYPMCKKDTTCYDHLAGHEGIHVVDSFLEEKASKAYVWGGAY